MIRSRSGLCVIVLPFCGSLFLVFLLFFFFSFLSFFFFLGPWIGVLILVLDCALAYLIFHPFSPPTSSKQQVIKNCIKMRRRKKKSIFKVYINLLAPIIVIEWRFVYSHIFL